MVSNVLQIPLAELLASLARMKREQSRDPVYQRLRRQLPAEWPL